MSNCEHKWNGTSVMYTESGKRIDINTNLKWAGYTDQYRIMVAQAYQESICDPIVEVTTTCSKCGKELNPLKDINI